ncbi:hypothetical protein DID76_04475 [Candidatus Marinamargulisbacteria bacterium SCGC AG-414-C22]|nr:hypothetical protein DID76_04475 [Candidatus Marinamargulisbacteria bacterium SCGC AG-414-C22]
MKQLIVKKEWFTYIFITIIGLIIADLLTKNITNSKLVIHLFNTVTEKNIPTLFSTLQLIFSGILLWSIFKLKSIQESTLKTYWKALAIIFYFLAFDEWFTVHDSIGKPFATFFGNTGNLFGWTLLYIIIMTIFFIWSIKFLLKLPKKTALLFILSGGLFLTGAIGFEILAKEAVQSALHLQLTPLQINMIGLIEESLEMLSIFLFNVTLFNYYQKIAVTKKLILPSKVMFICFLFCIIDTTMTYIFNKNIL